MWATEADLYLEFVYFFVANAKGNMQRRLTLAFVSFCVGFCSGSSFPSNINIGEYYQHGMLIISLLHLVSLTSKLSCMTVSIHSNIRCMMTVDVNLLSTLSSMIFLSC